MARDTLRSALEQQGGLCFYCGRALVLPRRRCDRLARNAATADHLTPQALGGTDDLVNIVAACAACNVRKGMRRPTRAEIERKVALMVDVCTCTVYSAKTVDRAG